MPFIENGFLFSNNQSFVGNNSNAAGTYCSSKNNAPTNKTAWGANQNAQIGGMTVVCHIAGASNLNGGNMTAYLLTGTDNDFNNNGSVVATIGTFANTAAPGTMHSVTLPPGTQRLKFLGVRYTNNGNVDTGTVTCWLETGQGQVVD